MYQMQEFVWEKKSSDVRNGTAQVARTSYSSDSALFSLSQRQHSQNEFSQVRTQDLFTQNQSNGTQSESSFPQARKMSMYDKWMSKGAMFKKDHPNLTRTGSSSQTSFQQQSQGGQARDSDDRDLLQQVVNIVQDCNKDVKCTLNAVKEKLEAHPELPGDKLTETMKAFLEDIWKHEDRMLQAIKEGCQMKEKQHELEKLIVLKDSEIKHLQSQLEEKSKRDNVEQVAKAVRKEMLSPQLTVENKLMEILEATQEASEQHSKQLNQHKTQITAHNKQCTEWRAVNQKLFKDMEKRLQKDIAVLKEDLRKEDREWQNRLEDIVSDACSVNTQDMEKLIEKVLFESLANSSKLNHVAPTSSMVSCIQKELQAALQRQTKNMEKNVRTLLEGQSKKQQQQLQNLHSTLLTNMSAEIESTTERCQEKQNDEWVTPLSVPVFEEKIEEYHAGLKKQLEEMHRNHVLEVKRIQKEIHIQQSAAASTSKQFSNTSNTSQSLVSAQGCIPKSRGYRLQKCKELSKISPLTETERCNLFCKTKLSPVMTVVPRKDVSETSVLSPMETTSTDSDHEVTFSSAAAEPNQKTKQKMLSSKKRKSKKKKIFKKCIDTEKIAVPIPISQTSKDVRPQRTNEKQLGIYDFTQALSPEQSKENFRDFQMRKNHQHKRPLYSPEASTESYVSSPAVSVTVDTEYFMVRRSRWQAHSAPKQVDDGENLDMLSSPFFTVAKSQKSLQQQKVEHETLRRETRSRSAAKRQS